MRITYGLPKRDLTLIERGLDFEDVAQVFAGPTFEAEDQTHDYGEKRIICFGLLSERLVVVGCRLRRRGRQCPILQARGGRAS